MSSAPEVGSGKVAIFPTFQGFRKAVVGEVEGSAKDGSKKFTTGFRSTGQAAGKTVGTGFKKTFDAAVIGAFDRAVKEMQNSVAASSRLLSTARRKEQDDLGRVRVAQAQLNEAQAKYGEDSSQVIRAVERLASAQRGLEVSQGHTQDATNRLATAQKDLADEMRRAEEIAAQSAQGIERQYTGLRGRMSQISGRIGSIFRSSGERAASGFQLGFAKLVGSSFFGNLLSQITIGVSMAIGNAIGTGIDFIKQSLSASSDLNESVNAVTVAFGNAAESVLALGENSADSLGLSKLSLNNYATQFSAFALAIRKNDPASFLKDLTGRASDFASVFNIEVDEALSLFQSGLAGENEPLRRYGIDLSAAAVEQFALSSGLVKSKKALTEQIKQQARYGLLMQQTSKVQGDFSNTSDQLANSQRRASAQFEDAKAKLGVSLLPAMTTLANLANDRLIPILNQVVDMVGPELSKALEDSGPAISELLDEIAPLIPELIKAGIDALPVVIEALKLLLPLIRDSAQSTSFLSKYFEAFFAALNDPSIDNIRKVFQVIDDGKGSIADATKGFRDFLQGLVNFEQGILKGITDLEKRIVNTVVGIPQAAYKAIGATGRVLYSAGRRLIQGFINGIKSNLGPLGDVMTNAMQFILDHFPHSPAKRGPLSARGWRLIGSAGRAIATEFQSGVNASAFTVPLAVTAAATSSASSARASDRSAKASGPSFTFNGQFAMTAEQLMDVAETQARRNQSFAGLDLVVIT